MNLSPHFSYLLKFALSRESSRLLLLYIYIFPKMLRATISRTPKQLICKSPKAALSTTARAFYPHLKNDQDAAEQKEQHLFDDNKKKLDNLEHGKNPNFKQPGMEDLKKKGDDARIEQNRPDDGVY